MEAQTSKKPLVYNIGLVLLCLSLLIFILSGYATPEHFFEASFLANHIITLFYFLLLWLGGYLRPWEGRRKVMGVLVVLLLIDAYTVNREIEVFQSATTWYAVTLIILSVNILAFAFFEQWPEWARWLQCAVQGLAGLLPLYLALYLLNMYLISLVGLIVIGLSIVTFSPLFMIWFGMKMVATLIWPERRYRIIYISARALAFAIVIIYSLIYVVDRNEMDKIYESADKGVQQELPAWVKVAQQLPSGSLPEKILKTDLVYAVPGQTYLDFFSIPGKRYDDEIKHDPLFMTAAFMWGRTGISEADRMNILNVIYDKRHYAEEHFWSGDELVTSKVSAVADLWPKYHLAYTENTITVANTSKKNWPANEEAIYTFHLPEGAVVTSLSLWINGREEKAVLSYKQKAQAAYSDIVGKQYRDPSVVHWQEGNRVVVRVFPVPVRGERKFKIGITSPLIVQQGKLVYQPAWFEGPSPDNADYEVQLHMNSWPHNISLPAGFHTGNGNMITRKGSYAASWELKLPDEGIDNAAFSFNGQRYTLLPYTPSYISFTPLNYYLDVNNSWFYSDFKKIMSQLHGKAVWIYHPVKGMITVKEGNEKQLFEEMQRYRFSLFPFHKIPDVSTAIVITASDNISPQPADLENSSFRDSLYVCLSHQQVRIYDIGNTLSPYLATLKESRSLIYEKGTVDQLQLQITKNSFLEPAENKEQLVIEDAGLRLVRSTDSTFAQGPDHLARLFVYNRVLQQLGQRVTTKDLTQEAELISEAKEAYIVSPLSSLIVLETKADYDRFDIKDDLNSLKNASLKGHGAVPEPHEWALFIISVLVLAYVRFEKLLFRKKRSVC